MKKTKIEFYDFDGCIIASPEDTEGRILWKEKTGVDYPHIGWWGKPESLSLEIFDIQPVQCVLEKLDNKTDNVITVLLTARMGKLRNQVEAILAKHNIVLDHVTFKESYHNKGQRIDHFLNEYKDIKEVDFYDDTVTHFEDSKFLIEKYNHITFNFYHVKNLNKIIPYAN